MSSQAYNCAGNFTKINLMIVETETGKNILIVQETLVVNEIKQHCLELGTTVKLYLKLTELWRHTILLTNGLQRFLFFSLPGRFWNNQCSAALLQMSLFICKTFSTDCSPICKHIIQQSQWMTREWQTNRCDVLSEVANLRLNNSSVHSAN